MAIAGSDVIIGTAALNQNANTWYHIAVSRATNVTKLFVGGQQVGSDYTDANDYSVDKVVKVGAAWNNASPFGGWMENVIIRKGIASYSYVYSPTVFPSNDDNISFALDGEAPFAMETDAIYATYVTHTISSATADEVELWRSELTTEGVDLGRQAFRDCAEVIRKNINWIAEEAVGRLRNRYPDFVIPGDGGMSYAGEMYVLRDTKAYIIPAIIDDLIAGGNYNTTVVGRAYIEGSGALQHIGGEQLQSIYTWREVAKLCVDVITLDETDLSGSYSTGVRVPNYFDAPAAQNIQDFITNTVDDLLDIIGPTGSSLP